MVSVGGIVGIALASLIVLYFVFAVLYAQREGARYEPVVSGLKGRTSGSARTTSESGPF
jgi:hypothetical protein